MTDLKAVYEQDIQPKLKEELGLSNIMEVPRITKVTLNMGVGEAIADRKQLDAALADMEQIAGQKPVMTKARKSIAGFKVREEYPIGCKVTLRKSRMYEFLDRLIATALPRIRDFRGISSKGFDGFGNFSVGIDDQSIFPEIDVDKVKRTQGMDITIVTTAKNDDDAYELLKEFGMPFDGNRK